MGRSKVEEVVEERWKVGGVVGGEKKELPGRARVRRVMTASFMLWWVGVRI